MNLIVFDLEWNIGYQPKTFLYHGTELTLRGEIIQIGAVRINARGDVLDTFEVNLRPRIFRKLQHHIAKVTGLSQGDLDAGLPMKEGLQKFLDWAGLSPQRRGGPDAGKRGRPAGHPQGGTLPQRFG